MGGRRKRKGGEKTKNREKEGENPKKEKTEERE
jgi:hypothetical protein